MESTLETTAAIGTLTKDDLKALRQADRLCFDRDRDGTSGIRCIKLVRNAGPFGEKERTVDVLCEATMHGQGVASASCFEMIYNYHGPECLWESIASILKVGDVLSLEWFADNNNGYIDRALTSGEKIHRDELYIRIRRGEKKLRFHLATSICPNNTARMIRP